MAEIPYPGRRLEPGLRETYKEPYSQAAGRKEEFLAAQAQEKGEQIQRGFQIAGSLVSLSGQTLEFVGNLRAAADAGTVAKKEAAAAYEIKNFLQNMKVNPEGDPDWNTKVIEKYQEFKDELYGKLSEGFKTSKGQADFEARFEKLSNDGALEVNNYSWGSTVEKIKSDYYESFDAAVEMRDQSLLENNMLEAFNHGVWKADEMQKLREEYVGKIKFGQLMDQAMALPTKEALAMVNDLSKTEGLTSTQRSQLNESVTRLKGLQDAEIKTAKEAAQDESYLKAITDVEGVKTGKGELSAVQVSAALQDPKQYPELSPEQRRSFVNDLDSWAKEKKKEAEAKSKDKKAESDPAVYGEIIRRIYAKDEETDVTRQMIYDEHKAGRIVNKDFTYLQDKLQAENKNPNIGDLNKEIEKAYKGLLDNVRGLNVKKKTEEIKMREGAVIAEMARWWEAHPDAEYNEGQKYLMEIIKKDKELLMKETLKGTAGVPDFSKMQPYTKDKEGNPAYKVGDKIYKTVKDASGKTKVLLWDGKKYVEVK